MGVFMIAVAVFCCSALMLAVLTWLADTDGVFTSNILVTSAVIFFFTFPGLYEAVRQVDSAAALFRAPYRVAGAMAVVSGLFAAITFFQLLVRDPLGKLLDHRHGSAGSE